MKSLLIGIATATGLVIVAPTWATASPSAVAPAATATTVAVGTLTRDGAPIVGGRITLMAWPDESILAKLPKGGKVVMRNVADVRTDARGGFNLTVDWPALPAAYHDAAGTADFNVMASDGIRQTQYSMSAAKSKATALATLAQLPNSSTPDTLSIDLGKAASVTSKLTDSKLTLDRAGKRVAHPGRQAAVTTAVSRSSLTASTDAADCIYYAGPWHLGIYESFARVFGWQSASATFRQSVGAYHGVGVGFSVDGNQWSANGTATFNETADDTMSLFGYYDQWMYNRINYRDYEVHCTGVTPHLERRPVNTFSLLSKTSYSGHVWFNGGCQYYTVGTPTKNHGTDVTYSGGVSLLGIYVSATSGWNSGTNITWVINAPSYYCGSEAVGPVSSTQAGIDRA